jgi:hypothetical protein
MLRLINLLSASLLLLVIMTTTTTSAQDFLPGYEDIEKPEQPTDDMADCATFTNAILAQTDIRAEMNRMNEEFIKVSQMNFCETTGTDFVCELDYSTFKSNLQELCEASNDGQYDEHEQMIACQDATDATAVVFVYHVTNFPTCYAAECDPASLERFIARQVDDLEESLAQQFSMTCNSNYVIEDDDDLDATVDVNENGDKVSCPFQDNATPETCGPFEASTKGQLCNCYTFCQGELVGCDNQVQINTCLPGELVAGCTYSMFGMYDVEQSVSAVRATTSTAALAFLLVAVPTVASFL